MVPSQELYEYDNLRQVISGKKYWSDQTPVAGQQFEYAFDDIGNRKSTKAGGDQNGANLRTSSYSPNLLNQYTSRTVPNTADVLGVANAGASVTVNGASTYRKGEYFAGTVAVNNTTGAVYQSVNVAATLGTVENTNGNLFFAATNEIFIYDADGNLTEDGRWNYTWDGENRLIAMDSIPGSPTGALRKLTFAYDGGGRRVRKAVQTWNGITWPITLSNRFVYDGWNLIGELNATNNTAIRKYAWGLDLGGTMQAAGGVGGLAVVAGSKTNAVAVDGNGNVVNLTDALSGYTSARYQYSPFGELLRSHEMDSQSAFCYSTKYCDAETQLLNFGYRWLNPAIGAWISRDPLVEAGGINLFSFVQNTTQNAIDLLGLDAIYLLDRNNAAAMGQGHGAALIGNDSDGWEYYSFAPKCGPNFTLLHFKTLAEAAKNPEISRYESFLRFKASRSEDNRGRKKSISMGDPTYKPFSCNCGHVAGEIIKAVEPNFNLDDFRPKKVFSDNQKNADEIGEVKQLK